MEIIEEEDEPKFIAQDFPWVRPSTAILKPNDNFDNSSDDSNAYQTGSRIGEESATISDHERLSWWSAFIEEDDISDVGSYQSGKDLRKSKIKAKKKRFKPGSKPSISWKDTGREPKLKRWATVLVSKKIIREAKLRNMSLGKYIKEQGLDVVST